MSLFAQFVEWLQSKQSPERQKIMKHFDHPHTTEEARACLNAIKTSKPGKPVKWPCGRLS